jgi:hypothetical protein
METTFDYQEFIASQNRQGRSEPMHKSNHVSCGVDLPEPTPVRKRKSTMRNFQVVAGTIEFEVTARTLGAAYRRAARRVGAGKLIQVKDHHCAMVGVVPIEP